MTEIILEEIKESTGGIQNMNNGQLCSEHSNVSKFLETVNPDDAEFWNLFDYRDLLLGEINKRNIKIENKKYFEEEK